MSSQTDFYLISDLHFYHKNIIKYESRPWDNVEEMNDALIDNINEVVSSKDKLVILGDFAFTGGKNIQDLRDDIKCQHIEMVLGNHDRNHSPKWWRDKGFQEVYKHPIVVDSFWILSHEPMYMPNNDMPYVNIHGHLHSSTMKGQYFNVSVENIDYKPILFSEIKKKFIQDEDVVYLDK